MASDDDEIPETGAIFTFGRTRFAENLANKFWIRDDKVLQLACGDEHSALITSSGRLYTFGNNDWGQLGHGNTKPYTKPSVVKKLKGNRVKSIACGRSHSVVISESGVFSFGAGNDSQLGHGDNQNYHVPTKIETLNDKTIVQVSCGAEHSAAVTDNGELYVWGSGSEGQLGLGTAECELPSLLKFRSKVKFVACGYYHTAVITELGKLYTFGCNEAGKLGLEDNQCGDTEEPQEVKTLNEAVVFVACGGNHTAVVTKRASLFTFGSGMHGQLGHGPSFQELALPKLVSSLQGKFVSSVACGESHTAVLTRNGEMYAFGDGRHGKLGMGDESFSNLFQPTRVTRFKRFNVEQVSCGGCHMLAVAARKQDDIQDSEGSHQGESKADEDSDGEDQPDGPRLSRTVPPSGISARDKRRKKDTEGVALASSLPPLNRSLPPLASLGLSTMKKDENKHVNNGKLNPLDRSTLPIISIKGPSGPDDEENSSEKLLNSRRLPPRPKRRLKKTEAASDSEEENAGKLRGNARPTPLPRKQKLVKENENKEDNAKKFGKDKQSSATQQKSGSEASDEESDDEDDNNQSSLSRSLEEVKKIDRSEKSGNKEEEDVSEEEDDDEEDESDGEEEEDVASEGKRNVENGKKESKGKEDGKKSDGKLKNQEDKKNERQEDKGNETEDDEEESEEESTGEPGEDGQKEENDKEAEESGREDKDKASKDKTPEDSKKDKKDKDKKKKDKKDGDKKDGDKKGKKKVKMKEEEKEDKDKKDGKNKGKEEKDDDEEGEVEEEEDKEEENKNDDKDNENKKENDKDDKNKKTKKSGICILL